MLLENTALMNEYNRERSVNGSNMFASTNYLRFGIATSNSSKPNWEQPTQNAPKCWS